VVDESNQHVDHVSHPKGGRHFAIVISSPGLQELPRIEAHRKIYALFADLFSKSIHALRIKVI
jgi:stress-induced morphogen